MPRDFTNDFQWSNDPITVTYERPRLDGGISVEKVTLHSKGWEMTDYGLKWQPTRSGGALVFIPWSRVVRIEQYRRSL